MQGVEKEEEEEEEDEEEQQQHQQQQISNCQEQHDTKIGKNDNFSTIPEPDSLHSFQNSNNNIIKQSKQQCYQQYQQPKDKDPLPPSSQHIFMGSQNCLQDQNSIDNQNPKLVEQYFNLWCTQLLALQQQQQQQQQQIQQQQQQLVIDNPEQNIQKLNLESKEDLDQYLQNNSIPHKLGKQVKKIIVIGENSQALLQNITFRKKLMEFSNNPYQTCIPNTYIVEFETPQKLSIFEKIIKENEITLKTLNTKQSLPEILGQRRKTAKNRVNLSIIDADNKILENIMKSIYSGKKTVKQLQEIFGKKQDFQQFRILYQNLSMLQQLEQNALFQLQA